MDEFEFDSEFMSDEEVDQAIDSIVSTVGESLAAEEIKPTIVNIYKMQQIMYTYKVMKYLAKDMKGVKVSYELYKPFKSVGYIRVVGKDIVFRRPDWFMKAVSLANNFEAYPKTDGTVQLNFTFHGLLQPID